MKFLFFALIALFLQLPLPVLASDPLAAPNNQYGIHVIDENDLENAAALVNSSGGDYGYVTIVIREDDRQIDKWNEIFKKMRQLHLIPIVRLATVMTGDSWKKPTLGDATAWADFLSQLDWVVKNRYLILFNEPNHAKEWGSTIDPTEYAQVVKSFASILKSYSPDFFVLSAGLDASAPNSKTTMDEEKFLRSMISSEPNLLNYIDGWASHSYPNPGFVGGFNSFGRGTIRTYQWELNLLKSLGATGSLPVFITETGWPHQEGTPYNVTFYDEEEVAKLITMAAETVWNDSEIVAITPFVLNYQSYPFSNFSWQKQSAENFYLQYDAYRSIPKLAGKPVLAAKKFEADQTKPDELATNGIGKNNDLVAFLFTSIKRFFPASIFL